MTKDELKDYAFRKFIEAMSLVKTKSNDLSVKEILCMMGIPGLIDAIERKTEQDYRNW